MTAAAAPSTVELPARRSLAASSAGLVVGKVVQMGTGYLFWLVAARTASVHDVGLAAAAVSAVMLCTQIGLLGSGSAVIVLLGRGRDRFDDVVAPALGVVVVASSLAAGGALLVVDGGIHDGAGRAGLVAFAVVFLVAAVFGTVIIFLDQVAIALGRGDRVVPRYTVSGLVAVGALLVLRASPTSITAALVFACWTVDAAVSSLIGWGQLRTWLGRWVTPSFALGRARPVLRLGVPNHLLTLTERAPALLVPVLTARLVSPTATAIWYPAWMMAWVAYTAPVAVGLAQFSDIVRHPDRIRETTAHALRWSLLLGGAVAAGLALFAEPVLALLGPEYAARATGALRVLAVGLVPYAVLQAYNAVCRARGRLVEATVTGFVVGATACTAAVVAGPRGATTMALAWVATFSLAAVWCGLRIVQLTAPGATRS